MDVTKLLWKEVNGMIVPVKNVKQLQEKMFLLSQDRELYTRLQLNSRKIIIERYEQAIVWEGILNEYKELISSKS